MILYKKLLLVDYQRNLGCGTQKRVFHYRMKGFYNLHLFSKLPFHLMLTPISSIFYLNSLRTEEILAIKLISKAIKVNKQISVYIIFNNNISTVILAIY